METPCCKIACQNRRIPFGERKHTKKRHEAHNPNPGKCRLYMKRRGRTASTSVHYTESILAAQPPLVKYKSGKIPFPSIFSR